MHGLRVRVKDASNNNGQDGYAGKINMSPNAIYQPRVYAKAEYLFKA